MTSSGYENILSGYNVLWKCWKVYAYFWYEPICYSLKGWKALNSELVMHGPIADLGKPVPR